MKSTGILSLLCGALFHAAPGGAVEHSPIAIIGGQDSHPGVEAVVGPGTDTAPESWITAGQNPSFLLQFADVLDGTGAGFDDPALGPARQAVARRST